MKDKIIKYLKELIIFFILVAIFANIISFYRSGSLMQERFNFTEIKTIDKKFYKIKRDEPIMVHFWATWCPTCKLEASNIEYISKRYNVLTIAVKSGSDADIRDYLKKSDLDFSVVNDSEGLLAKRYGVHVFPTTIIYDRDGDMIFSDIGYTSTLGLWLKMLWAEFR